jgi:hypothetical protein
VDAEIVARVSAERTGPALAGAFEEDLGRRTVEAAREGDPLRSPASRRRRVRIWITLPGVPAVEFRGGRAAAHGIRERVEIGEGRVLDERERALEGGLVLARETGDDVRADGRVGQELANHRQTLACERRVVAARMRRSVPSSPPGSGTWRCGHTRGASAIRRTSGSVTSCGSIDESRSAAPALLRDRLDQPAEVHPGSRSAP